MLAIPGRGESPLTTAVDGPRLHHPQAKWQVLKSTGPGRRGLDSLTHGLCPWGPSIDTAEKVMRRSSQQERASGKPHVEKVGLVTARSNNWALSL